MPPTRPLATQCRYGLQCTRADCHYMHPKGRDMTQNCAFGQSCFRKVCHLTHPEGRLIDQLRPNIDYCAACTLVGPKELPKVSAAFEAAFPAANDGNDRCDFVAAVPMSVAFRDWKNLRGISATGTPDGVPSTPEKIRLFPRTRNGERLLQDPRIRQGMRWSPTPYRPWKTLDRMASHDQHWDENQDMYVLCAGYEDTSRDNGVCIELSVTGTVKSEDDGDAVKAGTRVAREILGLPGANSQTWFVFHVSRPEENKGEAQFVTVKAIVDPAKLPTVKSSKPTVGRSPIGFAAAAGTLAPPPPPASAAFPFPPRPSPINPPSITRPAQPKDTPSSVGRIPTPIGVASGSLGPVTAPAPAGAGLLAPGAPASGGPWPTAIGSPMTELTNGFSSSRGLTASGGGTASAVGYASSSDLASTDSELGSAVSFGAYVDEATAALAVAPPLLAPSGSRFFGGQDNSTWVGVVGEKGLQKSSSFVLGGVEKALPAMVVPMPVAAVEEDELSKLLERLNMSKYRSKFDSKQVDYKTLTMMTEEQLSRVGIPLGPRIKLMNELGIERPNT